MCKKVDLLVFGSHPDDIEIDVGGTIAARQVRKGSTVGLWDLTRGELGANGTIDIRLLEAQAGAEVWGASRRENLEWPDGDIDGSYRVNSAVEFVRRCRPATVLVPHWDERHPDHVASSHLLTNALFKSALRKYDAAGDIWRPDWACHDFINKPGLPCL